MLILFIADSKSYSRQVLPVGASLPDIVVDPRRNVLGLSLARHACALLAAANPRMWAKCNIRAAWILGEVCREGKFGGLVQDRQLRALEAALFMIGYELPTSA